MSFVEDGVVSECSASNLYVVRGGKDTKVPFDAKTGRVFVGPGNAYHERAVSALKGDSGTHVIPG